MWTFLLTYTLQENASSGDESDPGSPAHSARRTRHPSTPVTPTRRVSHILTRHFVPPSSRNLPSPPLQIPAPSPSPSSRLSHFRPTTPQRTPHPNTKSLVPSSPHGLKGKRSISASTPDMRPNGKPGKWEELEKRGELERRGGIWRGGGERGGEEGGGSWRGGREGGRGGRRGGKERGRNRRGEGGKRGRRKEGGVFA